MFGMAGAKSILTGGVIGGSQVSPQVLSNENIGEKAEAGHSDSSMRIRTLL